MEHLQIFYFFITFSIGIVSLGGMVLIYVKTREKLLQYCLFFYGAFTLEVVITLFNRYIKANMSATYPEVQALLRYLGIYTAQYLLMLSIPVFVHYLCSAPHAKMKNRIFEVILLITYSIDHYFDFVVRNEQHIGHYIDETVFFLLILYSFLFGIYYYKQAQDSIRKKLAKDCLILLGILLPGLTIDIFFREFIDIPFHPILYCGFSLIFTYHLLKQYYSRSQESRNMLPDDEFFERFHISERERELIPLILQGNTNENIGETLCISLNTVKTHIRNIYAKFGVKNRYELITLLKDACLSPLSSNGKENIEHR